MSDWRKSLLIAVPVTVATLVGTWLLWPRGVKDEPRPSAGEAGRVPTSAAPPPLSNADLWAVAYISEGYSSEIEFKATVQQFVASLMNDQFFSQYAPRFVPRDVFVGSRLGIAINGQYGKCYFDRTPAFGDALGNAITTAAVADLRAIVVLTNASSTASACTAGDVIIATSGADQYVPHEFGHLIGGLFDELGGNVKRGTVSGPNCTSSPGMPPWGQIGTALSNGCWNDDRLWNPGAGCRMGGSGYTTFCDPCQKRLQDVFAGPPAPAATTDYTQLLVQLWADKARPARVVSLNYFSGRMPAAVSRGPVLAGVIGDRDQALCMGSSTPEEVRGRAHGRTPVDEPVDDFDSVFAIMYCQGKVPRNQMQRVDLVRIPMDGLVWLTIDTFNQARISNPIRTFTIG